MISGLSVLYRYLILAQPLTSLKEVKIKAGPEISMVHNP